LDGTKPLLSKSSAVRADLVAGRRTSCGRHAFSSAVTCNVARPSATRCQDEHSSRYCRLPAVCVTRGSIPKRGLAGDRTQVIDSERMEAGEPHSPVGTSSTGGCGKLTNYAWRREGNHRARPCRTLSGLQAAIGDVSPEPCESCVDQSISADALSRFLRGSRIAVAGNMPLLLARSLQLAALTALAAASQPNRAWAQASHTPAPYSLLTVKATVPAGGVVLVTPRVRPSPACSAASPAR
jgi:hypothetical protein